MERVGFKEWALVCAALGDGRQSVLVRKGGLAAISASRVLLFPTYFHEQAGKTRVTDTVVPEPLPNEVEIRFWARIEATHA